MLQHGSYIFPDGSVLAPDLSSLSEDRAIKAGKERKKETNFFKTVPEFAIELISSKAKQERDDAQEKMTRYVEMGVDLGWVIDPYKRTVTVYTRLGQTFKVLWSCLSFLKSSPLLRRWMS